MILIVSALSAVLISFVISLYSTPIARKAAIYFNILDCPDGKLKTQKEPVPYLGGIPIFVSIMIAVSAVLKFDTDILGILLAGSILLIIGILDDLQALTPTVKLAGQLFAAVTIVKSDIMIKFVSFPWWINFPLTILWLVSIINAMNIIDVMDGLCTISAIFSSIFISIFAFIAGQNTVGVLSLSLTGALIGFFIYNKPKAKIYLGDAGSMLIGLFLAAMSMKVSYSYKSTLGIFVPIFILAVPIFDMAFVVIIRIINKKPFYLGSPDHFALRLRKRGLSVKSILVLVSLVSIFLGLLALGIVLLPVFYGKLFLTAGFIYLIIVALLLAKIKI